MLQEKSYPKAALFGVFIKVEVGVSLTRQSTHFGDLNPIYTVALSGTPAVHLHSNALETPTLRQA